MGSVREHAFKPSNPRKCLTGDFGPKVEMHVPNKQLVVTIPVPGLTSSFVDTRRTTIMLGRIQVVVQRMMVGLEPRHRAGDFLTELADRFDSVLDSYAHDHFPQADEQSCKPSQAEKPLRTKSAQKTIGVHSSFAIYNFIIEQAKIKGVSAADFSRKCFDRGLTEFDTRMWSESSVEVVNDFRDVLRRVERAEKHQWSLRLARKNFMKAISMATEYEMSRSQFALLCIVKGAENLVPTEFETLFRQA